MIAMMIACKPKLLIADEPTTALDVTIQAQILELLIELQKSHSMALILITHDMAVVAETAEHVVVLYAGQQVEQRSVKELFKSPQHPYSEALLNALPERAQEKLLNSIPGVVPGQMDRPKGCLFNPRCSYAQELCRQQPPELQDGILCHYPLVAPKPDLDVRTQ
jgi:dipeptide transport system ATP-binding protein